MAVLPPLDPEPSQGTKHVRDMKVRRSVCSSGPSGPPLCVLLLVVSSFVITTAQALEVSVLALLFAGIC
jgi:hypothetical protein